MKKYEHIFFDLDRTLYDFDQSTRETFFELYERFKLKDNGATDFDAFLSKYKEYNNKLWAEYREGKIKKKFLNVERFYVTLLHFGIDDRAFAGRFAADYLRLSPEKKTLLPGAIEILEYLQPNYSMHIITNGFDDVQKVKMDANDLNGFFKTVTTSEEAGAKKPGEKIFQHAMGKAGAKTESSIMIGDDFDVDIMGAKNFGLDQVLVIPESTQKFDCTYQVTHLLELKEIL